MTSGMSSVSTMTAIGAAAHCPGDQTTCNGYLWQIAAANPSVDILTALFSVLAAAWFGFSFVTSTKVAHRHLFLQLRQYLLRILNAFNLTPLLHAFQKGILNPKLHTA